MTKYLFFLILFPIILLSPSYARARTKPETNSETTVVTSKTLDKRQTGLRIYKPGKCYKGYTLFTHAPLKCGTSVGNFIYLIDIKGNILHQWLSEWIAHYTLVFARLKPNGRVCYIDDQSLIELDTESNIVWHYPAYIDHAFEILEDGNFLIERDESRGPDGIPDGDSIIEIISPDKKVLWRWRGKEHIDELERLIGRKISTEGDWNNNNTCAVLKENSLGKIDSRFRKGNIMFSYNAINIIGIIEYPSGDIVWAWGPGKINNQHTPAILANGNILIFDNGEIFEDGKGRDWSRIIEINPLTEKIVWEYHAEPRESFYSPLQSSVSELPNGNRLICEAVANRIFEITPEGEVVWDFISPFGRTTGSHGIFRAYRYSPEYVKPLLERIKAKNSTQE